MAIEREMTLNDYINVIKRRLPVVLSVFFAVLLLATAVSLKLPSVYESTATILIESQQVQSDPTITKEKYASDRFEQLKQVVLSNENLYKIADKYKLYGLEKKARPRADIATAARKNINASLLKAEADGWEGKPTFALEISYNYYKPEETYNVTNDIVKLFLEENDRTGKLRATETAEFYGKEAEKQRAALLKIESEVTKYKKMHANTLPENKEMHLESLDRLELDLRNVQREYSATQSELRSLDVSLESAKAGIGLALGPDQAVGGVNELEKLKLELDRLNGLYSENHPTVRALKRRIETIEKSSGAATTAVTEKRVTPQSVMVAKVQSQIDTANARLKSLEREEVAIRSRMSQIEGRVIQSAQTEGELGALLREYDNAKAAYTELKAKQDNAKIAKNIEMENKGERFVLTEAPIMPDKPIKPNRVMLLLAGLIGSIVSALGLALLLEALDKRVRGVSSIASIMKMQPIAAIPYITIPAEIEQRKYKTVKLITSILAAIFAVLLITHLFVMPLDVAATKLSAKF